MEYTFAMIKPDAVRKNSVGKIISKYEENGFEIVCIKKCKMTLKQAQAFYEVHQARPFFASLTEFMSSGPVVAMILKGENVILRNRELMGATNPENAKPGTIRKEFASNIEHNAIHGSDSPETAKDEITFFFSKTERLMNEQG